MFIILVIYLLIVCSDLHFNLWYILIFEAEQLL